ncbi:MAG: ferrochelatase, partial [Bacteroidales bacterium]|nr:ferrochelatase [Bacteroidales bacterium]
MEDQKTAILLLNIGSPTGTGYFKVATYLSRFLGERRVIDMPWLFRKTLVNCIIVPFRSFASSSRYKKLCT